MSDLLFLARSLVIHIHLVSSYTTVALSHKAAQQTVEGWKEVNESTDRRTEGARCSSEEHYAIVKIYPVFCSHPMIPPYHQGPHIYMDTFAWGITL